MHAVSEPQTSAAPTAGPAVVFGSELADLAAVYRDEVSVVIVERPLDARVVQVAEQLTLHRPFERTVRVPAASAADAVLDALVPVTVDETLDLSPLWEDLRSWLEAYALLTGAELLGVRLAVLATDMCPRFHVDRVLARLVVTYAGPGTEVLEHADRRWLGHAAGDRTDETSGLMRGPAVRAPTGAGVLMKGEAWPGAEGKGAVHRSPAIAAYGQRRLVLTVEGL